LNEFEGVIRDFRIPGVTVNDANRIFSLFDKDGSGDIDFNEMMEAICGPFPANRLRIVSEAFDKLDSNGNGLLEMSEVKDKFDPSRHPEVILGRKTAEEARANFFDMFNTFHAASNNMNSEKSVTKTEFIQYHHYLNE
jgi:Ca2+-binding EF-hand superfamily protein